MINMHVFSGNIVLYSIRKVIVVLILIVIVVLVAAAVVLTWLVTMGREGA